MIVDSTVLATTKTKTKSTLVILLLMTLPAYKESFFFMSHSIVYWSEVYTSEIDEVELIKSLTVYRF